MKEFELRRKLAGNLELIESGLTLVQEEYHIPKGPLNNSAFIDILAKDRFNKFVIIELKKNNQSARQAIHELFKYTALFSNHHNINKIKIRTFLISAEWDELRIPFSEYIGTTECQTTRYQIVLNDKNEITRVDKITPLEPNQISPVFVRHYALLFTDGIQRDKMFPHLAGIIKNCGCKDFLLLYMEYTGSGTGTVYPFAIYIVPVRIEVEIEQRLKKTFFEEYKREPDDPFHYQDQFLAEINGRIYAIEEIDFSGEIGYPEKFTSMLKVQEWVIEKIHRYGCYESSSLLSDKEIEIMIAGYEGQNIHHFNRITNTTDRLDWQNTKEKAFLVLEGITKWKDAFSWFTQKFCDGKQNLRVLVKLYTPHFISNAIYEAVVNNDRRYFPEMELIAFNEDTTEIHALHGFIEWNYKIILTHFNHIYNSLCKSFLEFQMAYHFGEAYLLDEKLVTAHGLEYVCKHWSSKDERDMFLDFYDNETAIVSKEIERNTKPLREYFEHNREFIYTVIEGMAHHIGRIK